MTITQRILTQVALATGLVIAVATAVTYAIVFNAVKQRDLKHLETHVAERARREEAGFRRIEANLETVRGQFLKRMAAPTPDNVQALWERRFELFPDGAWRSRKEFSDGRKYSTMWMHRATKLTPALKVQILRAQDICDELLPTWGDSFPSLYFNFPGPANIGFDPTIPSWVWDAPADYNMNGQEWVYLAFPTNNPSRGFAWTGVLEEEVTKTPQVAVLLPIYIGDEMLCAVAHSLNVRGMMEEATHGILPGVSHLTFRRDGRLIAHPTLTERIIASKGLLTAQTSGDANLIRLHRLVIAGESKNFSGYDAIGESYYTVARLAGPDWFFVTALPRALLQKQAFASAQWVLWSGLLSLALVLGVFTLILRRQVAVPLAEFTRATNQMSAGDTNAHAAIASNDELGRLAGTFNEMIRRVAERDSTIRGSERRWRMLFEQSPLSVQVFSPTGHTLSVNAGFKKLWGAVPGPDYSLLEDPQLAASGQMDVIRRAFAGEVVFVPATRYNTGLKPVNDPNQPKELWVQAVLYPVLDDAGRVQEVVCIHEDITARKKVEDELRALNQSLEARVAERTKKLRESEERFSKAFQASPALIALTRLHDGQFVAVNEAFYKITGFSETEVIGRRAADLNIYAQLQQRDEYVRLIEAHGSVRDREHVLRTKQGALRTILTSGEMIDLEGQRHLLTVGLDITDRKQAEVETLRALDREKDLNELKSNFISMVSHEFRTPLGIIISSTDILHRYLDRLTVDERETHFTSILGSVQRMASMMEDVLLIGRFEGGRLECQPDDLHLAAWCRRLVDEMYSATGGRCPIELNLDLPEPMVQADEKVLRHILTNLISNAVKYSPMGTAVQVHVRREKDQAVFEIRDRGRGIPAADQPHIFEAFRRARNVGQIAGTGLGLVIVQRGVNLHGGTISVDSKEGTGTTFVVRLPLFEGHV